MSVIDGFWTGSTDDIYRGNDQTKTLTDYMVGYDACIKTLNKSFTLTGSNNTFSVDVDTSTLEEGKAYLVSFSYISSGNALLDRSTCIFYYSSARVVPTFTISYPRTANDGPMIANVNGKIRFATSYYGETAAKCEMRIL